MCLSIKVRSPERVLAEGIANGHEWVVMHNNAGFRCGYVKVKPGHPWHGQEPSATVHGGITFAEADVPCGNGDDNGWWVGFDCAHLGDAPDPLLPGSSASIAWDETVRDQEYVEEECRSLCKQANSVNQSKRWSYSRGCG